MKLDKTTKIVIFLLIMVCTAYSTFVALILIPELIWFYFNRPPFTGEPSGGFFIPIVFVCAIAFFVSLVMLIKTVRGKQVTSQ
jgi:TRAP-type C4-dicarboxylate transport system permease small subunit